MRELDIRHNKVIHACFYGIIRFSDDFYIGTSSSIIGKVRCCLTSKVFTVRAKLQELQDVEVSPQPRERLPGPPGVMC